MRISVPLLLALFLMSCSLAPSRPEDSCPANAANVWMLIGPSTRGSCAPVHCEQQGEGSWRVTFLTAKHVVDGDSYLAPWIVTNPRGDKLEYGIVSAMHPTLDVALVTFTSDRPFEIFEFIDTEMRRGDPAWVVGYPLAQHLSITKGWIGERFHVSAPIIFGNSGGPVLDYQGRIVGVISTVGIFRGHPITHMACFVPILDVRSWIQGQLRV